jgi:hypothetical protein
MNLTNLSKYKLYNSFKSYQVDKDYADPIYNYLVHGYNPGSFFTSVLANDFLDAIARSHPGNTIPALKHLVTWIVNELPEGITHGSYEIVDAWTKMSSEERRVVLEQRRLIYTEQDEVIKILKGVEAVEPVFW